MGGKIEEDLAAPLVFGGGLDPTVCIGGCATHLLGKTMTGEPLIALEVHDATLWEPSRILPLVDRMERYGYNALVLHQNDLLDAATQLGLVANYGVSDLRLKKVRNVAAWLNRLVNRLDLFGARLFLEIKEPSFHDYALELYPDLLGADGQPDPQAGPWAAFCRAKVDDVLTRVPGLGGLIVNLSSPESRVSLPDFLAIRSAELDRTEWFDAMIAAFHEPLRAQGKDLYVRDFSYTEDMQSDVLSAVDRCDGAVGASIKITAHDYFPEFPENPAAKGVSAPVIFEFEAFGEHMGWGVVPNCRVAEFRRRMEGYRAQSASGILMRVSWEAITGANALDSLSDVNVFALPKLISGDVDELHLTCEWLTDRFGVDGDLAERVAVLLDQSWHVVAASYWNGTVFPRHSCLPSTWQEGWLSMDSNGMGRRDRDLGDLSDDPRLSDEAKEALFRAKAQACDLAITLAEEARALASELPSDLRQLLKSFDWLPAFARQFDLATRATFFAARGVPVDAEPLAGVREDLLRLADDLARRFESEADLPHHYRILLDPDQIRLFVASLPAG